MKLRLGVRVDRINPARRKGDRHEMVLSDGSSERAHEVVLSIGRTPNLDGLGLETIGVELEKGRVKPDDHLRIAENTYVIGDPAGPEMHTHLAHYEGEIAVHIAHGREGQARFLGDPAGHLHGPRDGAASGCGSMRRLSRGTTLSRRRPTSSPSAKGNVSESFGHATAVVDRKTHLLLGMFVAGPGASEAIHEAVLAIKTKVPIEVLADTIHAFPTTARVMGGVFVAASRKLNG